MQWHSNLMIIRRRWNDYLNFVCVGTYSWEAVPYARMSPPLFLSLDVNVNMCCQGVLHFTAMMLPIAITTKRQTQSCSPRWRFWKRWRIGRKAKRYNAFPSQLERCRNHCGVCSARSWETNGSTTSTQEFRTDRNTRTHSYTGAWKMYCNVNLHWAFTWYASLFSEIAFYSALWYEPAALKDLTNGNLTLIVTDIGGCVPSWEKADVATRMEDEYGGVREQVS